MLFSFNNNTTGKIGISFHDGGVTIGQCSWKNGGYSNPNILRVEKNPRDFTPDDWRSLMCETSTTGSDCVLSLPTSIARHQVLRLPNMSDSELKEAASWEMADRLGVERSILQIDAIPVGTGGDVLAVAIEQTVLSGLLDPLYAAGLRPTTIEPECISTARTFSMLHRRHSDQSVVRSVLDFGTNDSCFMVLAGDHLMFYKHFEHSGKMLVSAIESQTGVTSQQAIKMLDNSRFGVSSDDFSKVVRDATRSTHEAIATDVMKCMRHYGVTNRGPLSSYTIITGSSGWNQHLANILSNACNQEVVADYESKHIKELSSEVTKVNGWHLSLGASLSNINTQKQRRGSDHSMGEAA
ncbi:MAG: hypothetical protein QF718_03710 [Phycisphaerales bacterium]|jgi:Tfp pilus assembly PilM family ATPase|nr:hypothetical protein [Phycisphaerales bacterium]